MERLRTDRAGPGQGMAIKGIRLATEAIKRGAAITIRWVPGHARVPGNEVADQWASEAATREHKYRMGRGVLNLPTTSQASRTSLKTVLKKKATVKWRSEVVERCKGRKAFHIPGGDRAPGIPEELRRAPKEVASRSFQLASGHAMIAPFLKDKFGWLDSDMCWWCGGGRQSREHLFKECSAQEISRWENCCQIPDLQRLC